MAEQKSKGVVCRLCNEQMELETRPKTERGERRHRYVCPMCGAHTRWARTPADAWRSADIKAGPERCYTREPVLCPYYRQHSYKDHKIQCESCITEGIMMSTSFYDKRVMILHMQNYCRGKSEKCPVAIACTKKYE